MNNIKIIESPNDDVLQEDLSVIADSIDLRLLSEKTVLVTGSTGLIGSLIVKALMCANRNHDTKMHIVALARNEDKVKRVFGELVNRQDLVVEYANILDDIKIDRNIDYIIHTASQTASKAFVNFPVETIKTTINGTQNVLELARAKKVKGMVYLSSMEVYGITSVQKDFVTEEDLGYIDILSVRSSYSEGKRMAECLCASYASEYNVPVVIARLAQTFGAGIDTEENRVFAQFARSAMQGKDIVLHTNGESVGNYCYTADAITAIILLLLKGKQKEAYTIANEKATMMIKQMAQLVADEIAGNSIKVVFDIPEDSLKYGYAPNVAMRLSAKKLCELGWEATVGMKEAYIRMIKSIKNREVSS